MGGWESHLHRLHIRGQSCQSNIQSFSHRENLLEVCGHHLRLNPKPPVRGNGHAVLPFHGHYGPAVIGHNRLEERRTAGTAGAAGGASGCGASGCAPRAGSSVGLKGPRIPPRPGPALRPQPGAATPGAAGGSQQRSPSRFWL